MRLIDNDEVVVTRLAEVVGTSDDLIQTAVTDEVAVFVANIEILERFLPVGPHCRWEDD